MAGSAEEGMDGGEGREEGVGGRLFDFWQFFSTTLVAIKDGRASGCSIVMKLIENRSTHLSTIGRSAPPIAQA